MKIIIIPLSILRAGINYSDAASTIFALACRHCCKANKEKKEYLQALRLAASFFYLNHKQLGDTTLSSNMEQKPYVSDKKENYGEICGKGLFS